MNAAASIRKTCRPTRLSTALIAGLFFSFALAKPFPSWCDDTTPAGLKTRVTSISLFKNGLGFVIREGEVPKGNLSLLLEGLPAPAHGTFWVYSPDNPASVQSIVAFERETAQQMDPVSLAELIEANVGQTVDLRTGDKETIRAKILSVSAARFPEGPAIRSDHAASSLSAYPAEPASLVLLQTAAGTIALNKNTIQQITSVDGPLKTAIERKRRGVALRVNTRNPDGKGRLIVQYLAKGITWAPSCAVDISDPKQARVTFKAEIINEIEDLENAAVNFITGYPNLQFADVTDPMAMRGNLAAFLNNLLNPQQSGLDRSRLGTVLQQAVVTNAPLENEDIFPAYAGTPQEGRASEELFFYEQKGTSLKKGERGYYPLFTVEAPYAHVYEWKIGDLLDEQERYRSRDPREPEKTEEVWHSIKLTNAGAIPWTTAPAVTMQGGQVLGQDLIHYTSAGSGTTVRITRAVDVKAEQTEYEVERKRNAANFYGSNYDLVEVRGKLKISNFKNKDVSVTITKNLSGEVIRSAPEARVEQLARALRKVNPHSVLNWELPVKARDKSEIEYSYRTYVRD